MIAENFTYMRNLAEKSGDVITARLLVPGDVIHVRLESSDYNLAPKRVTHVTHDQGDTWIWFDGDERIRCSSSLNIRYESLLKEVSVIPV